jgi:tRNA 2-thiouridine synthesizing protein C
MKKAAFINRRAPHGSLCAWEGLELALTAAAFELEVTLIFLDDGVYQLKNGQDTSALGIKNFAKAFGALNDYGVRRVCVEASSLEVRGLSASDLCIPVETLTTVEISALIEQQELLLGC